MTRRLADIPARLPSSVRIFLILSLALLPIGLASAWSAKRGLDAANAAIEARAHDQARAAGEAIEALLSRNALALHIATSAALSDGAVSDCRQVHRLLTISPAEGFGIAVSDANGKQRCVIGDLGQPGDAPPVQPGDIRLWIGPTEDAIYVRAGVSGGAGTARIPADELRNSITDNSESIAGASIVAGGQRISLLPTRKGPSQTTVTVPIASGSVNAELLVNHPQITRAERLFIFLPLLMWAAAAIVSSVMVHRLLIRPLRRLQRAVVEYEPGEDSMLVLPPGLGPAKEIHELGATFERAVARIEGAEHEAREALEGQRRLVREVHHRVKNNLQVVASLLSIHGRIATEPEAKAAYASISRRVDALSVVHRNHYAELEEARGIALRPLLTELAAGLRASAPDEARAMAIELELTSVSTTQDAAITVSFLVTEIVEFAMLRKPADPLEITLRRKDELTATLALSSSVLVPETADDDIAKQQFERIVEGLARQLRSSLRRKLGRYAVTVPVFPKD